MKISYSVSNASNECRYVSSFFLNLTVLLLHVFNLGLLTIFLACVRVDYFPFSCLTGFFNNTYISFLCKYSCSAVHV